MDQDGANTKYLTLGNELVLTPDSIGKSNGNYMSYFRNMPEFIYLISKLEHKKLLEIFQE